MTVTYSNGGEERPRDPTLEVECSTCHAPVGVWKDTAHRTPPWLLSQGFSVFGVTQGDLGMVTHTRARARCMRGLAGPP
jgi:hypothetical protein